MLYTKKGDNMNFFRLTILSIVSIVTLYAGEYKVDLAHSYVGFKIKHLMISNVKGNFENFSGKFTYDEENKKLLTLDGKIDVNSINTSIAKRDKHLRSKDFFDVDKYPNITFVSSKIKNDSVYGKLTMHGITKEVKLDYEFNGIIKDPRGKTKAGLSLSGKLNRKDFGLKYNSLLEAGGVAIGDSVKLDLEFEAVLLK